MPIYKLSDKEAIQFSKSKIALMRSDAKFLSTLFLQLEIQWVTDEPKLDTAGTDGKTLWIDYKFWHALSHPQQQFLLLHETMHVGARHMLRRDDRDPDLFNIACDYVINNYLSYEAPFCNDIAWIDGGVRDTKCIGKSAEQIYEILFNDTKAIPKNTKMSNDVIYVNDPNAKTALNQDITTKVIKAAQTNKGQGNGSLPSEIQILLNEQLQPLVKWTTVLRRYLKGYVRQGTSYSKISRRYLEQNLVMPAKWSKAALDTIVIYIDISGSVTTNELTQLYSEMKYIHSKMKPKTLIFKTFNTQIVDSTTFNPRSDLSKYKIHISGGTDLRCVREDFNATKKLDLVIVLSDLQCTPMTKPDKNISVIWGCINNPQATVNFGKLLHMAISKEP